MNNIYILIGCGVVMCESIAMYCYLHKKTHISLSYLYKDNLLVCVLAAILTSKCISVWGVWAMLIGCIAVPVWGILLTMIRFFRFPLRKKVQREDAIISPADGNIIYIKRIEKGDVPMSTKEGVTATLQEFANVDMDYPCIIIGINMTPFDVHRNAVPISGRVIMNKHFDGETLSLKNPEAIARNERNTIVLDNGHCRIGVVQTASRLVRRVVTYCKVGDTMEQGQWFGMIKFGSQVDVIIPANAKVCVNLKEQVYVRKTILATLE